LEYSILIVEGGIGKNICATGVVRAIKDTDPDTKIIVIAGFPDVFHNNKLVQRCFNLGNAPYLIDDYIRGKETTVYKYEPYLHNNYIHQRSHVISCWCEGLGLKSSFLPEIFLTSAEKKTAEAFVKSKGKPIFVLQTHGGVPKQRMFYRNLENAQGVVNALKHKYHFLHFRLNEQPPLDGTEGCMFKIREVVALLNHAAQSLVIDSFIQHASAAIGKKLNVVWGGTSPVVLGYESNNNIVPKEPCPQSFCHRPNSWLFDVTQQRTWECPHDEMCFNYTVEELLTAIGEK
jgi:hypothetical protein